MNIREIRRQLAEQEKKLRRLRGAYRRYKAVREEKAAKDCAALMPSLEEEIALTRAMIA